MLICWCISFLTPQSCAWRREGWVLHMNIFWSIFFWCFLCFWFCFLLVTLRWLSITIYVSNNFLKRQKKKKKSSWVFSFLTHCINLTMISSVGSPTSCLLFFSSNLWEISSTRDLKNNNNNSSNWPFLTQKRKNQFSLLLGLHLIFMTLWSKTLKYPLLIFFGFGIWSGSSFLF